MDKKVIRRLAAAFFYGLAAFILVCSLILVDTPQNVGVILIFVGVSTLLGMIFDPDFDIEVK